MPQKTVTNPAPPSRPKLKAVLALASIAVLVWLGFSWFSPASPPEVPQEAMDKVIEALQRYYLEQQALIDLQRSPDPLAKAKPPAISPTLLANPPNPILSLRTTNITERKSRNKLILKVRPSFAGGLPPDGVAERTIILFKSDSGEWTVQPILPDGAPPFSE